MAKKKEMTLGEACRTILKGLSDAVFDIMSPKDFTIDDGCCGGKCKPKRARGKKGRYLADDPRTKEFNEAWVGGKAPKKKKKSSGYKKGDLYKGKK